MFKYDSPDTCFDCKLECKRCTALTKAGTQCNRNTRKQLPYCFQHARSLLGLEIKDSTIPNAGLGVFATKPFAVNEAISPYIGETLTKTQMEERYGQDVAPYALKLSKNRFIDSACKRGTGSFINTKPGHNNARFSVHHTSATVRATRPIPAGKEIFVTYGPRYKTLIRPQAGVAFQTKR